MTTQNPSPNSNSPVLHLTWMDVRASWSRPISMRADVKLAPSMVRPNLFSGD